MIWPVKVLMHVFSIIIFVIIYMLHVGNAVWLIISPVRFTKNNTYTASWPGIISMPGPVNITAIIVVYKPGIIGDSVKTVVVNI